MGDVRMNHQPTHKTPTSRYDRLNPGRKAPDTWNIDQGNSNPGKKKVTPEDLLPTEPDPKLDAAVAEDIKKRNLKTRKPRTPKTKDS